MSQRERVKAAFQFKEVWPVPYWFFGLSRSESGMARRLDEYFGKRDWRNRLSEALEGQHVGFIQESLQDGTAVDTFGVLLEEGNITHVLRHPLEDPSLRGFVWPDPERIVNWDEIRQHFSRCGDQFRMCGLAMGLFERSWFLRGFQNAMMDMVENPGFYEDLLDGILDIHLRFMDLTVARVPIEAYYGGDDVSDQRGIMMGLPRWQHFFKPRLAKLIAHAHELGVPYVLHACGNVLPLIDDLIEISVDGLESLQPEATNVFEVKRIARGRMVLIGAMGMQSTLFRGTPEDVCRDAHRLLDELGSGGGYVIAPSKPFEGEPVENVAAFLEVILDQDESD